ncbi:MlaD family protein [Bdellovibrio sp. NC01]|uniref:MlaD family protein n=1 Tax=Bdellovibrio sp. NC01 TaxID=2220073 RepID=UPI001158D311|nr:MlaD family protein [Bdellovibrio sp. NC01]QDK39312.1 MCE family protein [Bdellovibrio sp. NC01]
MKKETISEGIEKISSKWYIWFFPVVAFIITAVLMWRYFEGVGPKIKIYFDDGANIQAERTRITYRGVTIGMVNKVSISDDNKEVIAYATLQKDAEDFAVEGTKFWIVTPKVSIQGISGLETLIQGPYIATQPGKGAKTKTFKGKLESESNDPLEDTVPYHLETTNVESINPGDSVTYRGMKIGSVTKVNLSKSAQTILVQINVQDKFVRLVRSNTVFWRKVGIQAKLGLFKSEVKINSLDSIIHGGIDMFTPEPPGEISKWGSKFVLYDGPPKDYQKWNPKLEAK